MNTSLMSFLHQHRQLLSVAVSVSVLSFCGIALAAIVVGASSTGISDHITYTNLTLNTPASVSAGDVMLASIVVTGGSAVGVTAPSGWTEIARTDNDVNVTLITYWKVAVALEPSSYSWTMNTQTRAVGGITRYSGVDTTHPIDVSSGNTGFSTSATTTAVTTGASNEEVVAMFGTDVNKTLGTPTGMTQEYTQAHTTLGPTIAANDVLQVSAGNSGSNTSSIDPHASRYWAAQQIALKMQTPIAFDSASAAPYQEGSATETWSHTVSGTNTVLIACGASYNNDFAGATYDSVAMTQIEDVPATAYGASTYIACYGLLSPPTGTHSVVLSRAGSYLWMEGLAESFSGVSQSGLPDAVLVDHQTAVNPYVGTLSTVANNAWGVVYALNNTPSVSAGSGTTLRQSDVTGSETVIGDSAGPWSPAGSHSLSLVSTTASDWDAILVSLAPAN
jgi:hypothetical protein